LTSPIAFDGIERRFRVLRDARARHQCEHGKRKDQLSHVFPPEQTGWAYRPSLYCFGRQSQIADF
jgi:hypothetical protein